MKLAIKQPYFLPYIGFWQEVSIVDTYVIFDDVNYIKKGWINRNYLLVNGERHLFTLSLSNASQNRFINEIDISDNFDKLLRTIDMAYHKAPFFKSTMSLVENILSFREKNLARFVGNSIIQVANWLGIRTSFVYSSELSNDKSLRRQDRIIDICKTIGADFYFDSTGAVELYDKKTFGSHGICLQFVNSEITHYKQFEFDFVPYLSILDVLMFNDLDSIHTMLTKYELI